MKRIFVFAYGLACYARFLVALLYAIAANALLNVGHVRFLQTGKFDSYTDVAGRLRDLREGMRAERD